jgi:PAS domain S-box-containing protein
MGSRLPAPTGAAIAELAGSAEVGVRAYRALYEHCPDGVLFTVPDGRVLAANPAACQVLGLSEAEIRTRGRQGLADPTDDRWVELLSKRHRAGDVHGVARMLRRDGTAVEIEMSSQIFTDDTGETRTCTVIRDVSDRERLKRELLASQAQLAEAERIAKVGSWQWDAASDTMRWSQGLKRLYGLDGREDIDHSRDGRLERVHPDDRPLVTQTLERATHDRAPFSLEYRAITSDGRVRVFHANGDTMVGPSGKLVSMVGVVQDVTETVRTRDALRYASHEFERRAAELQRMAAMGADESPAPSPALSLRQLEVLRLIAQGLSTKDIAARLVITPAAVKWHVRAILSKTGTANRAEAVAHLLRAQGPNETRPDHIKPARH